MFLSYAQAEVVEENWRFAGLHHVYIGFKGCYAANASNDPQASVSPHRKRLFLSVTPVLLVVSTVVLQR